MAESNVAIEVVTIAQGRLSATVLSLGASLMELAVEMPEGRRPVILSLGDPEAYRSNPHYLGVIAGRCANRIWGGECVIDGKRHQLDLNENGETHLHGGSAGFSRKLWQVTTRRETSVTLTLQSPDGDQGYPGTVTSTCRYDLLPDDRLRITLSATTDATTLVNLAAHAYFNLSPGTSVLDHGLTMPAHRYMPVDAKLIPDGLLLPVSGTGFDFTSPVRIGTQLAQTATGFDHNFVLADAPRPEPALVARLVSPNEDLALELWSTEPGLQFYDGAKLSGIAQHGPLRPFDGCCLEPQRFPDAIHHPHFASAILQAGERYQQVSEYRFLSPNAA